MMYNKRFYHSFFCENKNQNINKNTFKKKPVWNVHPWKKACQKRPRPECPRPKSLCPKRLSTIS